MKELGTLPKESAVWVQKNTKKEKFPELVKITHLEVMQKISFCFNRKRAQLVKKKVKNSPKAMKSCLAKTSHKTQIQNSPLSTRTW